MTSTTSCRSGSGLGSVMLPDTQVAESIFFFFLHSDPHLKNNFFPKTFVIQNTGRGKLGQLFIGAKFLTISKKIDSHTLKNCNKQKNK